MNGTRVTSRHNPRFKALGRLTQSRARRRDGVFLVEGERELRRAQAAGYRVEQLWVAAEGEVEAALDLPGVELFWAAPGLLASVLVRPSSGAWLGVVRPPAPRSLQALLAPGRPQMVLDGVEKPGNVGAIVRSLEAAGWGGVITVGEKSDWYAPQTIRNSAGAIFSLPHVCAPLGELVPAAAAAGYEVVRADPVATAVLWQPARYRGRRLMLVLGSESCGVGEATRRWAQSAVRLPLCGAGDSLNVAVAAGIFAYTLVLETAAGGAGS